MSSGYNNHGITGTAIAFMNGKKGRGNGDNHRDHSSHKPFETGCTTRDFYLRYTHLPDSVSGYRKRVVKKRIALPPDCIKNTYVLTLHNFVVCGGSSTLTKMLPLSLFFLSAKLPPWLPAKLF